MFFFCSKHSEARLQGADRYFGRLVPVLFLAGGWSCTRAEPRAGRAPINAGCGAFVFGIGMQLGGGCASGTLYTVGGGSTRMLATLGAFIVGSLLREVGVSPGLEPTRPLTQDPASLTADRPTHLDPVEFPQVISLSAELLDRDFDADFEFGLDLLVQVVADRRPVKELAPRNG